MKLSCNDGLTHPIKATPIGEAERAAVPSLAFFEFKMQEQVVPEKTPEKKWGKIHGPGSMGEESGIFITYEWLTLYGKCMGKFLPYSGQKWGSRNRDHEMAPIFGGGWINLDAEIPSDNLSDFPPKMVHCLSQIEESTAWFMVDLYLVAHGS